jgi:hypothetical protein
VEEEKKVMNGKGLDILEENGIFIEREEKKDSDLVVAMKKGHEWYKGMLERNPHLLSDPTVVRRFENAVRMNELLIELTSIAAETDKNMEIVFNTLSAILVTNPYLYKDLMIAVLDIVIRMTEEMEG